MPDKAKFVVKIILPVTCFVGAVFLAITTTPLLASLSGMKPVMVSVTAQSAEGVAEADLDQAGLEKLETWIVEMMLQKSKNSYAEIGGNPEDFNPNVVASSVYVTVGRKKLAVIKVNMSNSIRLVTIMGIEGAELQRVNCIRASNHDISVWSGECGKKIEEIFGVSLNPQVNMPPGVAHTAYGDLNTKMIKAANRGDLKAVTALVGKGADVNAKTSSGYSALSGASGKDRTEVVKFLIGKGANVNERLRGGTNALDEASFWGSLETVRLLLANGANPNIRKDNGFTPLHSAAGNGHVEIIELLVEHGADVNARSQVGNTALHYAAIMGRSAAIELLLEEGVNPDIKNSGGYTYRDLLEFGK